jgi:hypothetical protein
MYYNKDYIELDYMDLLDKLEDMEDMDMEDKVVDKVLEDMDYKDIDLHNCLDNKLEHIYFYNMNLYILGIGDNNIHINLMKNMKKWRKKSMMN